MTEYIKKQDAKNLIAEIHAKLAEGFGYDFAEAEKALKLMFTIQGDASIFKFEMGEQVIDTITNYIGTITARANYLNGENRYLLENKDTTGRPIEWWYEESRLERINE